MTKTYEIEKPQRMALVAEMLETAKGRVKEEQAINSYVAWHEAGESYPEPDVSGIVSWKLECAISSDLAHIYREQRPEGVFGSQYDRQYIRIRREAARRAAARRNAKKNATGMDKLRAALTL